MVLAGFNGLSAEDQEKIRKEILKSSAPGQSEPKNAQPCCDPSQMTQMMRQMMEKMKSEGCNPAAMCGETAEKTEGKCCG